MKSTRLTFFLGYLDVMMFSLSIGFASDGVIARIDSLSPDTGRPDDIITLTGAFGKHKVDGGGYKMVMAYQGDVRKRSFDVESWSENQVKFLYGLAVGHYDVVIVYNQFRSNSMRVSVRRPPHPNLSLDGVTIGFGRRKPTCGDHVTLKPEEVRWLPDRRIDFDAV